MPYESVWIGVGALVLVAGALVIWRMVRGRRARLPGGQAAAEVIDVTPRGRLVALSTSTKSALASRFGPAWRAKTTEELATEAALRDVLGPEMLGELIEFLDRIDRLKFAPERRERNGRSLQDELAAWNPRVAGLIARIQSKANGRHEKQGLRASSTTSNQR